MMTDANADADADAVAAGAYVDTSSCNRVLNTSDCPLEYAFFVRKVDDRAMLRRRSLS